MTPYLYTVTVAGWPNVNMYKHPILRQCPSLMPRSDCIASFGLLTGSHVRDIRSLSSWHPASADHREPIVPHGGAEERLAFPRGEGEAPAMWILQQDTNVRLHLRGMERCGDWASQERASTSNMSEAFWCNRLGGNGFSKTTVVW